MRREWDKAIAYVCVRVLSADQLWMRPLRPLLEACAAGPDGIEQDNAILAMSVFSVASIAVKEFLALCRVPFQGDSQSLCACVKREGRGRGWNHERKRRQEYDGPIHGHGWGGRE